MPHLKPYTCRGCTTVTNDPDDTYVRWCRECQRYAYEIDNPHTGEPEEPIRLNLIIGAIQRQLQFRPSYNSPVRFGIESFTGKDGHSCFRAVVFVNNIAKEFSRREQGTPSDALRELYYLCVGTDPKEI